MKQYLDLVSHVLENGEEKNDRTGTGILSVFGAQARFDLRDGFPMVTSKKVTYKNIVAELLWFLSGETNINTPVKSLNNQSLHDLTRIWDDWADESGELGPIYGKQWVKWEACDCSDGSCKKHTINQIQNAIDLIQNNPNSRRILVSAWNPDAVEKLTMSPPFCHTMFQYYVYDGWLDCHMYQRSADLALGVPYNIASYSTLLAMIAKETGLKPRYYIHSFGDMHIYKNHVEGMKEQLTRKTHPLPTLKIADKPFWDLTLDDFELENYVHEKFIKFPIAV